MINTVLFDMDGVITNTEKLHFIAWKKAFKEVNHELSYENYKKNLQSRKREIGIVNELGNPNQEVIGVISKYKSLFYDELINADIEVFEDAVNYIKKLHSKVINMAVVSSSSYAEMVIKRTGLKKYFKLIVSGTNKLNIPNKPQPDIYIYAMEKLGVSPQNCLIIEDSLSGLKAAIESKAEVVFVNRENDVIKIDGLYTEVDSLNHI